MEGRGSTGTEKGNEMFQSLALGLSDPPSSLQQVTASHLATRPKAQMHWKETGAAGLLQHLQQPRAGAQTAAAGKGTGGRLGQKRTNH